MNKITNYYYNELKYSAKLVNYVLYKFVCRQLANCARKKHTHCVMRIPEQQLWLPLL